IATAGTRKRPLVVKIKNQIDGKQPSLPGEKPPEACQTAADCPPDFPGCTPTKTPGGGKGWGASCEENKECREGLICLNGFCEQGEAGDDDDDDDDGKSGDAPLNFFTLGAQFDLMVINSAENVCGTADSATAGFSQSLDNYFCYTDTGEYLGKPAAGAFNEVQGGLGFSGVRILLGYDRILWKGLAVGVRAGFAIGGAPGPGDAADRFAECDATGADCHESRAATFPPVHGELRASYFIPSAGGFLDGLLQPYAFIGGGLGRVDAGVPVALCDYVENDGYTPVGGAGDDSCPAGTSQRDNVKAYQISGLGFMDFGLGTIIGFHPMFGVSVEAKFMLMLPTVGFVVSPNIAPVFMF
ncbi:MAG: hypothetical protein KC731_37290, partial [Myxococcales bacterium]|nr:hypothetical protein [Myxococcales bacterium]